MEKPCTDNKLPSAITISHAKTLGRNHLHYTFLYHSGSSERIDAAQSYMRV